MELAIDIGYGDTKVFYEINGKKNYFKFPSSVERVRNMGLSFTDDNDGIISFNNARYRAGDDVISDVFDTRSPDFLLKYSPILIYKALELISHKEGKNIDISNNKIYTGLSILNWHISQDFANLLSDFVINGVCFNNKISLFAQGQGVFYDTQNIHKKEGFVSIVDIGFNTLDVITFKNGKPVKDLSFATEFGTHLVVIELQSLIEKTFNINVSELEAKKVLKTKKVKFFGEEKDFSNEINQLKEMYFEELLLALKSKNKKIFRDMDHVVMSGGGAYFLDKKFFPSNVIFTHNPYEFSNVRGYFIGG